MGLSEGLGKEHILAGIEHIQMVHSLELVAVGAVQESDTGQMALLQMVDGLVDTGCPFLTALFPLAAGQFIAVDVVVQMELVGGAVAVRPTVPAVYGLVGQTALGIIFKVVGEVMSESVVGLLIHIQGFDYAVVDVGIVEILSVEVLSTVHVHVEDGDDGDDRLHGFMILMMNNISVIVYYFNSTLQK